MPAKTRGRAVISVSLPRDLVERANVLIPRTRRSRVIGDVLTKFLDAIARRELDQAYTAYYVSRPPHEVDEERSLLAEWELSDDEAWTILDRVVPHGRRPAR